MGSFFLQQGAYQIHRAQLWKFLQEGTYVLYVMSYSKFYI